MWIKFKQYYADMKGAAFERGQVVDLPAKDAEYLITTFPDKVMEATKKDIRCAKAKCQSKEMTEEASAEIENKAMESPENK